MVASLTFITLTLSALSLVSACPVTKRQVEANPVKGYLESYSSYHDRYIKLQCSKQHKTPFFDKCCKAILSTATLDSSCDPANVSLTSSSTAEATSTSAEQFAPPSTPTTTEQEPTSTTEEQAPPTSADTPPPTTTSSEESQPTQSQGDQGNNGNNGNGNNGGGGGGGDVQTGGFATWFTQNGVPGACGTVHGDGDYIAAIDIDRYGYTGQQSSLCGKQVQITNTNNGKSVTVTIADACPTCNNGNSIDLSQGAFQAIADLGDGLVPIDWHFV